MGTNYYSVPRDLLDSHVPAEGFWDTFWSKRDDPESDILHVGKSSSGWCFSLHIIPERGITTLGAWVAVFGDPERVIIDEYRDEVDMEEMLRIITCRSRREPCNWGPEKYDQNYAEPGPNNLARHAVGRGCVAHGPGTWDLISGVFS